MTARPWTRRPPPGLRAAASGHTSQANAVRGRNDWRALAERARSAANLALAAEDDLFPIELGNLTARCAGVAPPLENASDRLLADALRLMCRSWLDRPAERRAALSDALGALARLVDDLLTDEQHRAALVWRRHSGGD